MDLYIVNGRIGNDLGLCVSPFITSVIYSVVVSQKLFGLISSFDVLPYDPIFNDVHKPISLQMYLLSVLLMTVIVYMLKNAAEYADMIVTISNSTYSSTYKKKQLLFTKQ